MSSFKLLIRSDILEEVKQAKFYSIIADEVSNKEELSLVIRYLHEEQVREVFVDFVEVEWITGKVLGETILRNNNISPADVWQVLRWSLQHGWSQSRGTVGSRFICRATQELLNGGWIMGISLS